MAFEAVYKFLSDQNRPHNFSNIQQAIGDNFTKSEIQKAVDQLVKSSKAFEKTFGKQKVYCVSQSEGGDRVAPNEEINEISGKLAKNESELRFKEGELKKFKMRVSVEEVRVKKRKLEEEVEVLKGKLEGFDGIEVDVEEKRKVEELYGKYLKEYRKRKRICDEIIGQIMENYPKRKEVLLEEIGIETDEDVGFTIKK